MRRLSCEGASQSSAFLFSLPENFHAPVAQYIERRASNAEVAGEIPAGSANLRRVSPTTRGAPLRTERSGVEIPHAAPNVGPAPAAHVVQRRDSALKTRTVPVQLRPWAPAARVAQCRGTKLKPSRVRVQVPPRAPTFAPRATARRANLECQPDKRAGPRC